MSVRMLHLSGDLSFSLLSRFSIHFIKPLCWKIEINFMASQSRSCIKQMKLSDVAAETIYIFSFSCHVTEFHLLDATARLTGHKK